MNKIQTLLKRPFTFLLITIIAILLVGEVLAFVPIYHNSIEAWKGDDGSINYSVSTSASSQYTAIAFDNGDIYDIERIMLYYDSNYPSHYINDFLEDKVRLMIAEFKVRNSPEVVVANALEVRETLITENAEGTYHTALIMMTGVLPDTIYNATVDCPIVDWLNGGGVLYWIGDALGMYKGTRGGHILDRYPGYGEIFFGGTDDILVPGLAGFAQDKSQNSEIASALNIEYNIITFGIDTSYLDNYLSIGYTDGTFDSLLLTKFHSGEGMIVMFGGPTSTDAAPVIAQMICSKINYSSSLLTLERGELQRSGATNTISSMQDATDLYIYLGTPFVSFAKEFNLTKL